MVSAFRTISHCLWSGNQGPAFSDIYYGPETGDVLSSLNLNDDELKVYTTVAAGFEHFAVRSNIIFERIQFNHSEISARKKRQKRLSSIYVVWRATCISASA